MTLLFERGLTGERTGETVSVELKWEKWGGMGGAEKGEAARPGPGREASGRGVVSRACPPSPYHLHGSQLPGRLQVAPALCSCSRRRGFERADSEYTDKLQHYTSGHSMYTPGALAPSGPSRAVPWQFSSLLSLPLLCFSETECQAVP